MSRVFFSRHVKNKNPSGKYYAGTWSSGFDDIKKWHRSLVSVKVFYLYFCIFYFFHSVIYVFRIKTARRRRRTSVTGLLLKSRKNTFHDIIFYTFVLYLFDAGKYVQFGSAARQLPAPRPVVSHLLDSQVTFTNVKSFAGRIKIKIRYLYFIYCEKNITAFT